MIDPGSAVARLPRKRVEWAALLRALNVRPSKSLGQNFLVEHSVVQSIVRASRVGPGDRAVEVGPGLGILTGHLLDVGANVTAVELDRDLIPHLQQTFAGFDRLTVIESDVLKLGIDDIVPGHEPYVVVANLPYGVASPVIMHFLAQPRQPASMTVMLQREVAERLAAEPPAMSVLSVAVQALATPKPEFLVAPGSFLPPPKVESAVVTLIPHPIPRLAFERHPLFFKLVNAGFRHKRKQLLNSLAFELEMPKEEISTRLSSAGIDPMRRAQTLSVDEWITLLDVWERA